MNYQTPDTMQLGRIGVSAPGAENKPQPKPTDMLDYMQRVDGIAGRLSLVIGAVEGQIGRIYGEGAPAAQDGLSSQAPGLHGELLERLSHLQLLVGRLEDGVGRLSQHG